MIAVEELGMDQKFSEYLQKTSQNRIMENSGYIEEQFGFVNKFEMTSDSTFKVMTTDKFEVFNSNDYSVFAYTEIDIQYTLKVSKKNDTGPYRC